LETSRGNERKLMKAFGLPDETRIERVHLRTADLSRAVEFYTGVLGFRLASRSGARAGLSAAEGSPTLLEFTEDRAAKPRVARSTGLYHFAVRFPTRRDLARAFLRLQRHNYPLDGASDHLVSEAFYLTDPDQNGVELYADRPRSQWVWRDGQVSMSTEPLDLDDLLKSAGHLELEAPMPPETDIGHIHLHVADLPAAERFYRDYLGLAVVQRGYPGALFFSAGGYHHHVGVNTWAGKAQPLGNSVGLLSFRVAVSVREIIYCLLHRAPLAGYTAAPAEFGDGDEGLRIRDPNGNWLEIQYRAPADAVSNAPREVRGHLSSTN
jgi:catechol 2,3-dioxygenase